MTPAGHGADGEKEGKGGQLRFEGGTGLRLNASIATKWVAQVPMPATRPITIVQPRREPWLVTLARP
jgi:hypothetical protein